MSPQWLMKYEAFGYSSVPAILDKTFNFGFIFIAFWSHIVCSMEKNIANIFQIIFVGIKFDNSYESTL